MLREKAERGDKKEIDQWGLEATIMESSLNHAQKKMELNPTYIEKLKRLEKEKTVHVKDVDAYFGRFKK